LEGGGFIDTLPRTEVKHKIKEKEKKNAHNPRALAYAHVLSMKKKNRARWAHLGDRAVN